MNREIVYRTEGEHHGLIRRMISPGEIGSITKPFIFLDYINGVPPSGAGFGWHPHSGIATFTFHIEGGSYIEESTGNKVSLQPGDVEYLQAGSGAWHRGGPDTETQIKGFQLWIALPPELEKIEPKSTFLKNHEFESNETVMVLLGEYDGMKSKIHSPNDMNYLKVTLDGRNQWKYIPPKSHDVLWILVYEGRLEGDIKAGEGELLVFTEGNEPLALETLQGAGFILGSANKFEYDLVLGRSSVHTSKEALIYSQNKINAIYNQLIKNKKI